MTGRRKAFDRGRMVYTFALGSQKLYDFLHMNRAAASCSVDYTNNTNVASAHDKLVSVNNAIEIDLYGQVCSESSGIRHITGTGGQLDFINAAFRSEGGKGIVCLSSLKESKKGEKKSRIVPTLITRRYCDGSPYHGSLCDHGIRRRGSQGQEHVRTRRASDQHCPPRYP